MEPFEITDKFVGRTPERERVFVDVKWDGKRLSFQGQVIEFGKQGAVTVGQITEDVAKVHPRLAELWERWHLNDMRAGCVHQEALYRAGAAERPTYSNQYAGMEEPCPHCGYKYGSAWNYEEVPEAVVAEVRELVAA